ncbi:hypothetical protein BJY59DRAFT_698604 [Rhodotorula toruloides]
MELPPISSATWDRHALAPDLAHKRFGAMRRLSAPARFAKSAYDTLLREMKAKFALTHKGQAQSLAKRVELLFTSGIRLNFFYAPSQHAWQLVTPSTQAAGSRRVDFTWISLRQNGNLAKVLEHRASSAPRDAPQSGGKAKVPAILRVRGADIILQVPKDPLTDTWDDSKPGASLLDIKFMTGGSIKRLVTKTLELEEFWTEIKGPSEAFLTDAERSAMLAKAVHGEDLERIEAPRESSALHKWALEQPYPYLGGIPVCSTSAGVLQFYADPAVGLSSNPGVFNIVPRQMPNLGLRSDNGVVENKLFRIFEQEGAIWIRGDSMSCPAKLTQFGRAPLSKEELLRAVRKARALTEEEQAKTEG